MTTDTELPTSGALNVFYDADEQPWGFEAADQGSWRLAITSPDTGEDRDPPRTATVYPAVAIAPRQILTVPGWEETAVAALAGPPAEPADDSDAYLDFQDAWEQFTDEEGGPLHQVGGWPQLIQGPIWAECAVVSAGLSLGTAERWKDPRVAELRSGENDWRMLLQLDSDEATGWEWGDDGRLYAALRQSLPLTNALEKPWGVLQCY